MADITKPPNNHPAPVTGHLDALVPGTRLAEFEIKGLLGVGGFGMVYRGYDHSLHRAVAIKEYMPTSLAGRDRNHSVTVKSAADIASFESGLHSFIAEARLLARFDHPSLVKVYRFWESNNTAYMAMPLYEGITLKEARRRMSGPPPQAWLQSVLWSVLAGLKVLHDNKTLHRDVSPDNIFLQNIGPPVLLDLGAARRAILDTSQKHTSVLKVNYAPIEQYADAKDMQEGPWTDLYALAAVIHGCICNEPPLPATFRTVRDRMPSVAQIARTAQTHFNQTYSDNFVQAISHALAIEPTERTENVKAFIREIGMKSPPDLARFDWRNSLGASVAVTDSDDESSPIRTALLTTPQASGFQDTVLQPTTYDYSKSEQTPSYVHADTKSRSARPTTNAGNGVPFWLWLLTGALLLSLLAWRLRPTTPPAPVGLAAPVGAPTPRHATAAVIVEPAAPPSFVHPADIDVNTSGVEMTGSEGASASHRTPAHKKAASQAQSVSTDRSAPLKQQPSADANSDDEKPTPTKGPVAHCAEASILTRTMCIYRECQKPAFYHLPVCVADRKYWEEQRKSRN